MRHLPLVAWVAALLGAICVDAARGSSRPPFSSLPTRPSILGKKATKRDGALTNKKDRVVDKSGNSTSPPIFRSIAINQTRPAGDSSQLGGSAGPSAAAAAPVFGKPLTIIDSTAFRGDDADALLVNSTLSVAKRRGVALLNAMIGTNFSTSHPGAIQIDSASNVPILYTSFDKMYSRDDSAGSRIVDAASLMSDNICILMDTNTSLSLIDPIVRRLATNLILRGENASLVAIVDVTGAPNQKQAADEWQSKVQAFLGQVMSEQQARHGVSSSGEHNVTTLVFPVSLRSPATSRQFLLSLLRAQLRDAANRLRVSSLAEVSKDVMLTLRRLQLLSPASAKPIASEAQEIEDMKLNDLFLKALFAFRSAIRPMEDRLLRGRPVHGLGSRADAVARRIISQFEQDTKPVASSSSSLLSSPAAASTGRADKQKALSEAIAASLQDLREVLGQMLEREARGAAKRIIKEELMRSGAFPTNVSHTVRLVMDEFSARLSDAIPAFISEDKAEFLQKFESGIVSYCTNFPDSAEGRTEAAAAEQYRVERGLSGNPSTPEELADDASVAINKPKERRRRIKMGLGLVGMIRPPGLGNIQGYFGYTLAALGVPINLLFGFQNNGEDFNVPSEAVEIPLLKIQPKLHFDIDL